MPVPLARRGARATARRERARAGRVGRTALSLTTQVGAWACSAGGTTLPFMTRTLGLGQVGGSGAARAATNGPSMSSLDLGEHGADAGGDALGWGLMSHPGYRRPS